MAKGADSKSNLHSAALLVFLCLSMPMNARQSPGQLPTRSEVPEVQSAAISRSGLTPVPHPNLSKADASIKQRVEAARSVLNSSLERHETTSSRLAELYGNLGKLYHVYDFPDAAVACYTNAQRLAPQVFIWPYYSARVYQDEGDYASAIQYLKRARELRPNEVVVQLSLGQAYLDENQPQLAKPLFQSALELDKSSAAAMVGLGKIALSAGRFRDAIRYFESALAHRPQAATVHYRLAM